MGKGRAKVGAPHKIDKADTMKWFQQKYVCVEHRQAQEPLSEPPQQEAQEEVIGLMGDVVCGSGTRRVSPCVAPTAWHLAACRPPRALVCDPRAAGGAFILL